MKIQLSFVRFILGILLLTACSTDDLKRDIDDLKDRVESLEAQVNLLNDNMNTLRVFIDGNKTVTTVETTGSTPNQIYKLTLSDGQILSLTQGKAGEVATPQITINNDGFWVINGKVTDKKALGKDAPTPKFQIEESTSYWQVSYDEGSNWNYVTDTSGNNVKAVTDGSSSTQDKFFKEVEVTGNRINVTLQDNKIYSLPIVEDLKCKITTPDENYKNDIWRIGYGQTVTTKVIAKGDNILVTAPSGWKASVEISNPTTGDGTLTLTAPAATTRAMADNTLDVTIQVNKGNFWAVDKIQVMTEEVVTSYKALYDAGKDIVIDGHVLNKATFGESYLLDGENTSISKNGIYFIKGGETVNYTATDSYGQLIFIGDDPSQKSTLKIKGQIKIKDNKGEEYLVFKNLNIDGSEFNNYLLVQNGNVAFQNVIFMDCKISLPTEKNLTYISNSSRSFENFTIENCIFDFKSSKTSNLIAASASTATYGILKFKNNIFYCKDKEKLVSDFKLFNGGSATIKKIIVENNTFINMACNTNFYVSVSSVPIIEAQNNLFYFDTNLANVGGLFRIGGTLPTGDICNNNIVYKVDQKNNWQAFFGGLKNGFTDAEEIEVIQENPFNNGIFNLTTGIFVPYSTFSQYGAKAK